MVLCSAVACDKPWSDDMILDVIDLIVAPLVELNPIKYALDSDYREKKQGLLGRRARRIFCYQVALTLVVSGLIVVAFLLL